MTNERLAEIEASNESRTLQDIHDFNREAYDEEVELIVEVRSLQAENEVTSKSRKEM